MTVEDAVKVLNERRHNRHSEWYANDIFVDGKDRHENFTHFETVAIAEKYVRDGQTEIAES